MNQRITSHQLEIFCHLAAHLNFTKVADIMGLTRSAISHALKSLEGEAGARLFERDARRVALTDAGADLLGDARRILALLHDTQLRLAARSGQGGDILRLSVPRELCSIALPPVIREFQPSFPGHQIHVTEAPRNEVGSLFRTGHLDLAFVTESGDTEGAEACFRAEEEFRYVVHPLHPWAIRRSISAESGRPGQLIMAAGDVDYFASLNTPSLEGSTVTLPGIQVADYHTVKGLTLLDLGVGLLPSWFVAAELGTRELLSFPIGRRKIQRPWVMLRPSNRRIRLQESILSGLLNDFLVPLWRNVQY